MSAFASQIALTHCGHYATATGGADSPRALANKQYRALCIASRDRQGANRPHTARTNRSNQTSAGHVLPPTRPNTAQRQLSTPQKPKVPASGAPLTARRSTSTAPGSPRPQPPAMRSMAQVMMPPPADPTSSTSRGDGDRLRRELDQRKARLRREFYGVIFETQRSLKEAAAEAVSADTQCTKAASAVLARAQPHRSIPPYAHGEVAVCPTTGDGLGVGGPAYLLAPSPRRRLTALERLVQRSSAELQQLRQANAA